ncbi:MAG: hypothetical protein WC565_03325 [Parcubacteria group bacterium]|jgi:hypothetical protein
MTRYKYCLFSGMDPDETKSSDFVMGGLFAWEKAFHVHGGRGCHSSNLSKDLMEEFDIIHVNYTPGNASYIASIRDVLGESDTKIIANVDFSVGLWNNIDPFIMRQQLSLADFVFHVEPVGANILSGLLDRDVPNIPHPVDVERISEHRHGSSPPPMAACQYHRYMYTWHPYFYATYPFRRGDDIKLRVALMNHTPGGIALPLDAYFDEVIGRGPYSGYIDILSRFNFNMDITADYTYGRGVVEAAALGVPTIGSGTIDAMRTLFPDLIVKPYDIRTMHTLIMGLLTDGEFATDVSDLGKSMCGIYSIKASYSRLVEHLEETCLSKS